MVHIFVIPNNMAQEMLIKRKIKTLLEVHVSFSFLGKYKSIVISIALFLCLDASVLMLNFYISFEISEDAADVNLAGRQRMLSQRMVKSLINTNYTINNEQEKNISIQELEKTALIFDKTLTAFIKGGKTIDTQGNTIFLKKITDTTGISALMEAKEIWSPYKQKIDSVTQSTGSLDFISNLNSAITYANKNNLRLLSLMNTLTGALEKVASSKASRLRIIQTIGISLAIINFFIIMFHFLKQLRESDELIELARQETNEILDTVNEGLFLINRDLIIGSQHSKKLKEMFGNKNLSNIPFEQLLSDTINKNDLSTAQRFIKLLYREDIKSELIGDLNPLKNVRINISDESDFFQQKNYSFNFSRVYEEGKIKDILTTVRDITQEVSLAKELSETQKKSEQQFEALAEILHTNPETLKLFIKNCFQSYKKINTLLKKPAKTSPVLKEKLREISREIHQLKGESSSLGLSGFEGQTHAIENLISDLSKIKKMTGDNFFGLVVEFEKLIKYTESIDDLSKKLISFTDNERSTKASAHQWDHLYSLADSVATRNAKKVDLVLCGFHGVQLDDDLRKSVNAIAIQCIRNAIVHGIETQEKRRQMNKPPNGRIDLKLTQGPSGDVELFIQDDGQGLDYDSIRKKAIETGLWNDSQLKDWSNKQLASLIFHPGLSTTQTITNDAGRGVGMELVKSTVHTMGGKIRISSRQGQKTSLAFYIPQPPRLNVEEAA